jgi:hypothetical protein
MTYIISRAKIRRCGGQIDTSLAGRREAASGSHSSKFVTLPILTRLPGTNVVFLIWIF